MIRPELKAGKWITNTWAPNMGGWRDIPRGAVFHDAVFQRLKDKDLQYQPQNDRGDSKALLVNHDVLVLNPDTNVHPRSEHHKTYVLKEDEPFVKTKAKERDSKVNGVH